MPFFSYAISPRRLRCPFRALIFFAAFHYFAFAIFAFFIFAHQDDERYAMILPSPLLAAAVADTRCLRFFDFHLPCLSYHYCRHVSPFSRHFIFAA